jgi:hypothetical protein
MKCVQISVCACASSRRVVKVAGETTGEMRIVPSKWELFCGATNHAVCPEVQLLTERGARIRCLARVAEVKAPDPSRRRAADPIDRLAGSVYQMGHVVPRPLW